MRTAAIALTLVALLAAAGCSSDRRAAACEGLAFPLNAGLWTPAPGDIPR